MTDRLYLKDQNQIALFYESGTYGNTSGASFWPGQVLSHDPGEDVGVINSRHLGGTSRNVDQFIDGPLAINGTMNLRPQNWRMFKFALGKCADAGSPSPFTHAYTEANGSDSSPENSLQILPSFSIESFQGGQVAGSNFKRTEVGCTVNTMTVNWTQGEPVTVDLAYVGQNVTFASGAVTAVTEDTQRPYLWRDFVLSIPSGTEVAEVRSMTFAVNNNLAPSFYIDGSRVTNIPVPGNRDYTLDATIVANQALTKTLYNSYYLGGSTFNCMINGVLSAGSRTVRITMSGCKMGNFQAVNEGDGDANEHVLSIIPQSVDVIETNEIQYFNAGSYA